MSATETAGPLECRICHGARWHVWTHPFWSLYVNDNQTLLGKTMLSLNRYCESILELTGDEWTALYDDVRIVEATLDRLFQPDRYNLMFLMNAVHLHVVPRYEGRPLYLGETFEDPDWGSSSITVARHMPDEWLEGLHRALAADA